MFLHASLQLDAISQCTTIQDVIDTLEQFPSEINAVYHRTWYRICQQPPPNVLIAKTVLTWVLTATRSMTVEQLRHAVAISPSAQKFERKRLVPPATLAALCCGLVTMEEGTRLVRLVHYTAKDALGELLHEFLPNPHSLLARVCMIHLTECGFQASTITSQEFTSCKQGDPLLAYAIDSWAMHARRSLEDVNVSHLVAKFVSSTNGFPSFTNPDRSAYFDVLGPLHILALYNLPFHLIPFDALSDPNVTTKISKVSPIILASWSGNEDMVRDLLCLPNIDVNLTDQDGWSALMLAARQGNEITVRLLLAHPDIQVNSVDNEGWSALMDAAREGQDGIVKLLLRHPDIQVNQISNKGWSPLLVAALHGHEGVVSLFLARPEIEVNLVDNKGWSALMLAAQRGHEGVVRLLLAHPSIKVDLVTIYGNTALELAGKHGHKAVVRLLENTLGVQRL